MPIRSQSLVSMLASALALAFVCGGAQSLTRPRQFVQNATGECQSALSVFDGQLRKRPLAIQNEGTSTAFISCSLMGTSRSFDGVVRIEVVGENSRGGATDVTCTLVTGLSKVGTPVLLPKTLRVAGPAGQLTWDKNDNGGVNFDNFTINLSCVLSEGMGLSGIVVSFEEDVGA